MATPVPSSTDVECSAANVNDKKGSFVVSAAQRQSSPAASAAVTRSATLGNSAPSPLSIFTTPMPPVPSPPAGAPVPAWVRDP